MPKKKQKPEKPVRVWLAFFMRKGPAVKVGPGAYEKIMQVKMADVVTVRQYSGRLTMQEAMKMASDDMAHWPEAGTCKLRGIDEGEFCALKPACLPGEEYDGCATVGELAKRAAVLVETYGRDALAGPLTDVEPAHVVDLMIDLLHYASSKGWDGAEILRSAHVGLEDER